MYILKEDAKIDIINKSMVARIIGIDPATMSRVCKRKQRCTKLMAYAIVKTINGNAEIEEYFERVD